MGRTGVLIVSSDAGDADGICSALAEDESLRVTVAGSYREALSALEKQQVAVIICDGFLPDGNWKDLLGRMAMMNDAPRLVILAGADNQALWAEAISLGAWDVLAKPVAAAEIRHVCSAARRSQQPAVVESVAG